MATAKDLQEQLDATQAQLGRVLAVLEQNGILMPAAPIDEKERPDYIAFGSDKHRIFLGLVEIDDLELATKEGWTVYTSPTTGKSYHLADEVAAVQRGRGMDSDKAILFELRQKVGEYEAGEPKIPEWATEIFTPPGANFERIR